MVIPRAFSSGALSIWSNVNDCRTENFGADASQSSSQSGLTMVNVTDSADVNVRHGTIKFFFSHDNELLCLKGLNQPCFLITSASTMFDGASAYLVNSME